MERSRIAAASVLLLALAAGRLPADEVKGKVKSVDADRNAIIVTSMDADQAYAVAFTWIAVEAFGAAAGWLAAVGPAVVLLTLVFGGRLADGWAPLRAMLGADVARAAALLGHLPAGQVVITTASAVPAAASPDRIVRVVAGTVLASDDTAPDRVS